MKVTPATLEIERPSEPFEIETDDGKTYTLKHSKELPVETLSLLPFMSALDQLRVLVGENDFDTFAKSTFGGHQIDGFFMEQVRPLYDAHYGLGEPGEDAASSPS